MKLFDLADTQKKNLLNLLKKLNTQLPKILRKSVKLLKNHTLEKESKDESLDDVAADPSSLNSEDYQKRW